MLLILHNLPQIVSRLPEPGSGVKLQDCAAETTSGRPWNCLEVDSSIINGDSGVMIVDKAAMVISVLQRTDLPAG